MKQNLHVKLAKSFFFFVMLMIAKSLNAQQFTQDDIAVFVAASGTANNTTGSIVEFSATGTNVVSHTIPDGAAVSNGLRFSGSASSTGYLSNSNDGTLLCFTGHNNPSTSANANTLNPRGVGTFNYSGNYNLATTYTGTSGNQTRCATAINNSTWYIGDQGGLYSNGTTSASPAGNLRGVKSFGGVVYLATTTSTSIQVNTIPAPTGGTLTALPGLAANSAIQDFYLISSGSNGTAYDVLYVLSATTNTAGTITKYSLVSGTWVANGSYTTTFGGFGLAAKKSGSGAELYISTGLGALVANSVMKCTDAAGYNTTLSITTANNVTLYTASAGTTIKGVAFAPLAPPVPTVNLSVSTNSASEAEGTVVTVIATASSAVTGDQTVLLNVSGTGITTGDYTLSNSTITIPDGSTSGSVTFTVVDDAVYEGDETAMLTISNPSSGITPGTTISQNITIADNDPAPVPTVNLSVSSNSASEANATAVTVTATASSAVSGDQTVSLIVSGTNITAGDYALSNPIITIPAGSTSGSVTFTVVDDAIYEGSETATLTISNPSASITLGATTTQDIAIADNDPVTPVRITEYAYGGANGEFIEFTNVGNTAVDMSGWSFDDNSRQPGSQSLNAFGIIQPGESVILTENNAGAFRSAWNLCNGIKIIGGLTNNLGRDDEINLYDASNVLIDRLTYGDDVYAPGTIRANGISGYVNAAGLGANSIAQWTLSSVGDAEGSYKSSGGDIGSPGKSTRATVAYNPCTIIAGAPSILIDVAATTNYLDGGISTSPLTPFGVSGVINDPTDPAKNYGINFTIGDDVTPVNNLIVTVSGSNTTVVPAANLVLTGSGASRNLKITPAAVGYSNITISVNDGTYTSAYVINYAASAASLTPATTFWHTGMSDASDAIALDDDYFVSGDDELDYLNVYSRSVSGLQVASYDYSSFLSLPDLSKPEVDVEAATRSTADASRIYWLGSMSNGKAPFDDKPNRDRLFATTVTGTGSATTFSVIGYAAIRTGLIAWGDANGYNFSASAAAGVDSKTPSGFAAEGMVFGPDNTTLYIGLRAPLVPTANRTKAVVAPISNFESWFNNGSPQGNPIYGAPIELDLGQRGIRDLIRLTNGTYIILAGDPGEASTPAIYKWSGKAGDAPVLVTNSFADALNLEGAMQVNENGNLSLSKLQVISDLGDAVLYNDGSEAKDFSDLSLRKFRSDNLSNLDLNLCTPTTGDTTAVACSSFTWYGTVYTESGTATRVLTNAGGCDSVVTLNLTINQPTTGDSTAIACGSFTWYGTAYTASGTATHVFTNAAGCDSVVTLHLTINHSTTSTDTVFACGSYLWNGTTYTQSGTYTYNSINNAGCDSTAVLTLTINHSTTSTTTVSVCSNSLPFTWNGTNYYQSGSYTYSTTNAAGCDSVATLQLTVHQSPAISATTGTISCVGGTTYIIATATGGTKPYNYAINNRVPHRSNIFNNVKAGVYTVTVSDASGCTASMQYTITQPPAIKIHTVLTKPSCKGGNDGVIQVNASGGTPGYNYSINDGPYTASNTFSGLTTGAYKISVRDANGCSTSSSVALRNGVGKCPPAIIALQNENGANSTATRLLEIKVLPNPSITSFLVLIKSSSDKKVQLTVTDMYGRTVYQQTGSATDEYRFGNNFTAGMYILKVVQDGTVKTMKIIKGG